MTFDFLSGHFWWAETCATIVTQRLFLIFVIRGCHGGIQIMVDFDHLGYDLNCCGGFLDGIQNCIQTCLHHTVFHNLAIAFSQKKKISSNNTDKSNQETLMPNDSLTQLPTGQH